MREGAGQAGGTPTPGEMGCGEGEPAAPCATEVDQEVVRDLRHSVGNHFHKLYYWADRLGADDDGPESRGDLVQALNGALERFHRFLEFGLKYFEPDRASLTEMGVAEAARSTEALLRSELPECGVEVEIDPAVEGSNVRLDPQRFSFALRLLVGLLGGPKRESHVCRFGRSSDGGRLEIELEARGGGAPLEAPVIEWAIARKAIAIQGGALRTSPRRKDELGGCVVSLPFGG